jgi:hypothetical protein
VVVRKLIAVVLTLAVPAAALTAPFVHAHPDYHETAHHAGLAVHAHWTSHAHRTTAPGLPQLGTEDEDRAIFLNAFVAVATATMGVPAIVHPSFALPVPVERSAHRSVDVAHGHDPPLADALSPRAPPAFLA